MGCKEEAERQPSAARGLIARPLDGIVRKRIASHFSLSLQDDSVTILTFPGYGGPMGIVALKTFK
jgi:hypothetical protein